ncbi:hypothetical protein GCM10023200_52170 [Actinomycetospora chlora]|uniref:Uncharacterized protein n=1 Tax=Actinomycetospora chlora TaxID=663608 RepID=A0ABP9CD46_9PSEU
MDGQARHRGARPDGSAEYLVVVADRAGRFRDAYGPYTLAGANREAERHRQALVAAGVTGDVRIARHHPVAIPQQRGARRVGEP